MRVILDLLDVDEDEIELISNLINSITSTLQNLEIKEYEFSFED